MRFVIILLFYSFGFMLKSFASSSMICNKNELKFMAKCFCEPGWEATNITINGKVHKSCNSPILRVGGCECEPQDGMRSFLYNNSWFHQSG